MRRQKGLTLSGFMVWSVIILMGLLLGFKIAPPYYEHQIIQRQLKAIAEDPSVSAAGQRRAIEGAFVLRAAMENIRSIGPGDLQVFREGNEVVISADYTVHVPLFGNLSACMDFHATSRGR
jgi:hypothetical protein